MDFLRKVSGQCSDSESEDSVCYDKLQEMLSGVGFPKSHKLVAFNNAAMCKKRTLDTYSRETLSDDDSLISKTHYENKNQGKWNRKEKDRKAKIKETNFDHDFLNYVEKLQNRLDKQMILSENDPTEKISKEVFDKRNSKPTTQGYRTEIKEEELKSILMSKSLSFEDTKKLGEFLFHHKVSLKVKLFICLRLESESIKNRDVVRKIFNKSMMIFLESLLEKYCCTISVFGRKNVQIENKARPPKELCLLNPLIKLFASVSCSPHLRYINLHVTSLLINAVTFIASNMDNIQKRIMQAANGKTLICKTFNLNQCEASKLLTNIIGLSLDDWVFGAYEVILYGKFGKEVNKNINEEIIKIQPNMDCTKLDGQKFQDDDKDTEATEKYITVARTKAPKYIVMYTEKNWKDHLEIISDKIRKTIKNKSENYFRNGDVVGFYLDDVELEHQILEPVPLLRGLIVSQQKGNVMIWAMDVGTWVFARREKLYSLLNTQLAPLEPLISIGSLKGPVCDIDEEFLAYSLSVLRHVALKNHDVAKKMFLPDAGENLIILAEHHDSYIRHPVLDILLSLTKSREGCLFLHEKEFDLLIAGKLEFWVHVSKSGLRPVPRIKYEIATMVKILSAIISTHTNSNWHGMIQAKRALRILQYAGQDLNNELFEDVLLQLEDPEKYNERKISENGDSKIQEKHRYQDSQFHSTHRNLRTSSPQRNLFSYNSDYENKNHNKEKPKVRESTALVYENIVNIKSNETTHIMDGKCFSEIRPLEMAEIVCGLLNNNVNGRIYFGITQESKVVGMIMNELEKKIFRKDVDIIASKFVKPALPDSSYDVQFITILEDRNGRLQPKSETYVIEIKLYPHKRVVYFLHDGTRYYTRKGAITIEHNTEKKEKKQTNPKEDNNNSSKTSQNETSPNDTSLKGINEETLAEAEDKGEEIIAVDDSEERNNSVGDENHPDISRSLTELSPSGNLIKPVVHFLKKLMPTTSDE